MTGSVRKATLLVVLGLVAVAAVAAAGIPDPAQSLKPTYIDLMGCKAGVPDPYGAFTVTVNALNDVPTLNTLANLTLSEDASQQTVNLSGITAGATNEAQTLTVTVQQLPGSEKLAQNTGAKDTDQGTLNGVTVSDLDAQAREQFKIPATVKGVIITDVQPDSAAAEAGLKPGDVILEIDKQPVKTAEEAVRLTEHPKDKVTMLRLWSNGGSRYVVVDESHHLSAHSFELAARRA
jgi:membrane-associated protease RseP (regulator of RpoE activity)